MNDFAQRFSALTQYASGAITYGVPVQGVKASGVITVLDHTTMLAAAATGTITVIDFSQLTGKTITVAGTVLTEGIDFTAAVSNDNTAESIKAAVHALATVNATRSNAVVTVTAASTGTAGNAIAMVTNEPLGVTLSGATLSGGLAVTTITVNGTVLTAGVEFAVITSNDATATSLASAVAGLAGITASAVGAVVTARADDEGVAGNASTMVTSDATKATVSGATFAGGVDGDTIDVNGTVFTCVASSPGANEFSSITELNALVDGEALINSAASGGVITVKADAPGVAGNSITLAVGVANVGTMSVSGATLSGGVASTVSESYQIDSQAELVDVEVEVESIAGSTPTLTVTIQVSDDNVNFTDYEKFSAVTAAGRKMRQVEKVQTFMRFVTVLTGINTTATFRIHAVAKVGEVANNKTGYYITEDTSFVVGDSPAVLSVNTNLGRNANNGYITNDGTGSFTVEISTDGTTYGTAFTLKQGETLSLLNREVNKLRIIHVANSAYRVNAW